MKAANILILFLCLSATGFAQKGYVKDWGNAPLNRIPVFHTKNHYQFVGNVVKAERYSSSNPSEAVSIYEFNKDGNLTRMTDALGDIKKYYDSKGFLTGYESLGGFFDFSSTIKTDNSGKVLEDRYNSGGGSKYIYNNQGLFIEERYLRTDGIKERFAYDSQKRVVKWEGFDETGKLLYNTDYSYSKVGAMLRVSTKYYSSYSNTTTETVTYYNDKGHSLGEDGNLTYEYDQYGNILNDPSGNYYVNTYANGTVTRGKPSQNTNTNNTNTNNTNQPQTPGNTQTTTVSTGCVSGDCINGWGKMEYDNGYYDGFWKNGDRNGYGMYKWHEYGKYLGNMENGQRSGFGIYEDAQGGLQYGYWVSGLLNGLGLTVDENKNWEQGIFENGRIKTPYPFESTGLTYGCVGGDCQNGYGQYKWNNGDTYTGFFSNGTMRMGNYLFANGNEYLGTFNLQNQFDGFGLYYFGESGYYGGEFKNGQYHGRGYYENGNETPRKGEWENGTLKKPY